MRQLVVLCALAGALAATGVASAGGWATVSVDPLPTGLDAGDTWRTEITVLQHGETPLGGLSPVITVRESRSGLTRDAVAKETSELGVYEASVVFPEAGEWNVVVESGFWGEGTLTFGPVTIGDGGPVGASPGSFPTVPLALLALALGALAAGTLGLRLGLRRRWRATPVSR